MSDLGLAQVRTCRIGAVRGDTAAAGTRPSSISRPCQATVAAPISRTGKKTHQRLARPRRPDQLIERPINAERATGIEPARPAWKASNKLRSIIPVCGHDQRICHLDSAALPVWVEVWVENRRCPESVQAGAAWSGSVHPDGAPVACRSGCTGKQGAALLRCTACFGFSLVRTEFSPDRWRLPWRYERSACGRGTRRAMT
jgi:hypothetical protein